MYQIEVTKDIIDQNSANQNDPKPWNLRRLENVIYIGKTKTRSTKNP